MHLGIIKKRGTKMLTNVVCKLKGIRDRSKDLFVRKVELINFNHSYSFNKYLSSTGKTIITEVIRAIILHGLVKRRDVRHKEGFQRC